MSRRLAGRAAALGVALLLAGCTPDRVVFVGESSWTGTIEGRSPTRTLAIRLAHATLQVSPHLDPGNEIRVHVGVTATQAVADRAGLMECSLDSPRPLALARSLEVVSTPDRLELRQVGLGTPATDGWQLQVTVQVPHSQSLVVQSSLETGYANHVWATVDALEHRQGEGTVRCAAQSALGPVDVRVQRGSLQLSVRETDAPIEAEVGDGDLTLDLPAPFRGPIEAHSANGMAVVDGRFPQDREAPRVRARTGNGVVRVR